MSYFRIYRDSPVVRSREEVNVIKTVQDMAGRMQHAKTLEAQDPLNGTNYSDDSDLETATANKTPGTSTTTKVETLNMNLRTFYSDLFFSSTGI